MRVLIAGGGTGGHLYPGIALARELQRRDPSTHVSFVGTAQGIEARVVPREKFALDLIHVAGLKGKSRVERTIGFSLLPIAAIDAWRVIAKQRPDVVVGVGGFASGPVVAVAALFGYPTMLLEQNALPGITNRLLARVVRAAAVNFEAALAYFPRTGFVAGNPVRPEFFPAQNEEANDRFTQPTPLRLQAEPSRSCRSLAVLRARTRSTWHGGGGGEAGTSGDTPCDHPPDRRARSGFGARPSQRAGLAARVEAFIFEIDGEMKAADVVICRAGATTLAELAASATPAILVPLPTATDDHQRTNAEVVADDRRRHRHRREGSVG